MHHCFGWAGCSWASTRHQRLLRSDSDSEARATRHQGPLRSDSGSEVRATRWGTDWALKEAFDQAFHSWHVEQVFRVLDPDWKAATGRKKPQNWQQCFICRDVFVVEIGCFSWLRFSTIVTWPASTWCIQPVTNQIRHVIVKRQDPMCL